MTAPRLSPFPLRGPGGGVLLSDDFTAWPDKYIATGDAVLIDAWGSDPNQITLFSQNLFYWGNNPEVEQEPAARSTKQTYVYDEDNDGNPLPPNTLVRVAVDVAFYSQDFGAAGKPVGMWVNGVLAPPNVAASGTITPAAGQCVGMGRTNALGEITIQFGAENLTVSHDLHIIFDDLEITTLEAELADIFYDAGVLYIDGSAFSITRGGAAAPFDPGEEWEDYDFPGKCAPVEGLDELVRCRPTIRVRCMLTGERQFEVYRPDGTWADHATINGARVYTPAAMRQALATSRYPHDVIAVWPRQRGDYVGVHFPRAIGKRFTMASQDKDEGAIDVEFEARIPSGEPITSVPYRIVTYAAGTPNVG